jgi:hypothetical protein
MSATVTITREKLLDFIAEVDALATVENIRCGGVESPLAAHIYCFIEDFEEEVFGDRGVAMDHAGAVTRGRHLFRDLYESRAAAS